MNLENIIAVFFVITVIAIAITIIIRKNSQKRKVIDYAWKNCKKQIAVLLDKEKIPSKQSLTPNDENIICSIDLEEWKHWAYQVSEVKKTAKKYPLAFDDFISEFFPQIVGRKCVKESLFESAIRKRESLIDAMTMEELSLVIAETQDNWENRIKRNNRASDIKRTYPDGYNTYCDINKKTTPTTIEIIRDQKSIIELQGTYDRSKIYEGWIDRQNEFCNTYYNFCKEIRVRDGRYPYRVKFNHNDKFGKMIESEFKVWQGFISSYSFECDNLQPKHMISTRNNLMEWKNRERHYINKVFDGLFNLIECVASKQKGETLIVFVNSSRYNWGKDTYIYHYRYLKNKLNENNYTSIDFKSISNLNKASLFETVILIDLRTHNDDLKDNCRIVAEYFTKKQPVIAYYSYIKEYTKEEVEQFQKKV